MITIPIWLFVVLLIPVGLVVFLIILWVIGIILDRTSKHWEDDYHNECPYLIDDNGDKK